MRELKLELLPFYTCIDVENISTKLDLIEDLEESISRQKMITFSYKTLKEPNEIKTYENAKPYFPYFTSRMAAVTSSWRMKCSPTRKASAPILPNSTTVS